jgi:hypothetical protein
LGHRNGVGPHKRCWTTGKVLGHKHLDTRNLPHIVAMVTTAAMFSVRHVLNQQLSMDRPKQLRIRQKISMFL